MNMNNSVRGTISKEQVINDFHLDSNLNEIPKEEFV